MITWKCSCGAQFKDGHEAFLHRDGTDFHHVTPVPTVWTTRPSGLIVPPGYLTERAIA